MNSPRIAVQYLEYHPSTGGPSEVRERMRDAHALLPFDTLLLGWNAPPALEEAVAEEAVHLGVDLFRWQPILSGSEVHPPPQEWRTIGLDGQPVPGYNDLPEFAFCCPNHPAVLDWVEERVRAVLARGYYQGVFLDRIRFPSGSEDPGKHLACFCKNCMRAAAELGFDLDAVRRFLLFRLSGQRSANVVLRSLLGDRSDQQLDLWLQFRCLSVQRCIARASGLVRDHGSSVGLDCLTPSLARLVGQDLAALQRLTDWTKLMTYPRVFAPAGMAYEFGNLADCLVRSGMAEDEVLDLLGAGTALPFPPDLRTLHKTGFAPDVLAQEIRKCRQPEFGPILAGLPLVDMPGIHAADPILLQPEIQAATDADGIVVSWDLWLTGNEVLDLVRKFWYEEKTT